MKKSDVSRSGLFRPGEVKSFLGYMASYAASALRLKLFRDAICYQCLGQSTHPVAEEIHAV